MTLVPKSGDFSSQLILPFVVESMLCSTSWLPLLTGDFLFLFKFRIIYNHFWSLVEFVCWLPVVSSRPSLEWWVL